MSRLPRVFVVVAGLSLIATLGVGCKQGEGERCEQNSDCASGLTCSRMEVSIEGRCRSPGSDEVDASTGDDAGNGGEDAGDDAAAASTDAAGTDGAGTDASDDAPMTSDADSSDGAADASSPADAASDAGVD